MPDDIGDLRLLCLLVEAGSLSEAARRHESSPPAMSRRLAAMETRLGVRLFNRSSRRFTLTQEGALLHQRALPILAAVDEAQAEVSAGGVPRGVLRVGAPMQIGRTLIAPVVGRFASEHPKVSVQFVLSNTELDPIDDNLDIAIRIGMPDDQDMVARRILSSRRAVCASPDYLARHGTPRTPDDLRQHNCIRQLRGQRTLDHWKFMQDGRERLVRVEGTLATSSGEVLHEWILASRGIGQKALWNVAEDLRTGRLVECLPDYACNQVSLYAAFQKQSYMPARMRVFLDFLAAALAGMPRS